MLFRSVVARLAGVTRRSNDFAADERPFGVGAPRLVLGIGVADALEFFDVSSRNFFSLTLDCFNVNFPALGSLAVSSNRKGVDAISPHVISGLASTPGVKFGAESKDQPLPTPVAFDFEKFKQTFQERHDWIEFFMNEMRARRRQYVHLVYEEHLATAPRQVQTLKRIKIGRASCRERV